jgi:sulfur transfer complex TusBCD TusB component (DsrH family)
VRVERYLLIESSSPWKSAETAEFYRLARDLALQGHEVTLYLVQNGVLAARAGAREAGLAEVSARVRVLADDFSMRERGISVGDLRAPVLPAGIEHVADLLAEGVRAVWH